MILRKIIKINSIILVFLIISLLGNNTAVVAYEGHKDVVIDLSGGYTSGVQVLKWNEHIIFKFEITQEADFTFEIFNINASLSYFSINHENEHVSSPNLLDGAQNGNIIVEEGETLNHDNLPVGAHIGLDVVRNLQITEPNNYTLTFDNAHEHASDSVQFEFKFTFGLIAEEQFGTLNVGTDDDAPGFGVTFSIMALFVLVFTTQKFQRSKRI